MSLLDPQTLRRLLQTLEATDVDELEVTVGTSRIYVRREPGETVVLPALSADSATAREGVPIAAPLTGVFYGRPEPDQPPFVALGGPVEAGQVVALIESMKMFNEVIADVAGEIVEVMVREGEDVKAGQPLMFVRVHEEGEGI